MGVEQGGSNFDPKDESLEAEKTIAEDQFHLAEGLEEDHPALADSIFDQAMRHEERAKGLENERKDSLK